MFIVAAIVGSCAGPSNVLKTEPVASESERQVAQFRITERASAWSAQAGTAVLLRRVLPGERQQLIGLVNDTAVRGDNFLLLVAYGAPNSIPPGPKLETVLERVGGVPYPFENLSDSDLYQKRDALGPYFWKEFMAEQTRCVLAVRRLDFDSRIIPAGSSAMEVVLRNCVDGTFEEAIAPLQPQRLAFASDAAVVNGVVRRRVLNPLAAPGR